MSLYFKEDIRDRNSDLNHGIREILKQSFRQSCSIEKTEEQIEEEFGVDAMVDIVREENNWHCHYVANTAGGACGGHAIFQGVSPKYLARGVSLELISRGM
ncbi:MAG: hypothetical protein BRC24_01240 [Parcubacteria group bacterium SW_4_46_8]|nr:MAG: hypothetical protein BRC24_01240 [Parcubacteria group bacterium SW_4_46_8]